MQVIDIDYHITQSPAQYTRCNPASIQRSAILRLYGVTEAGNSVMVHAHNFEPYFYVPTWSGFTQDDLQQFGAALNDALRDQGREKGLNRYVMNINVVRKQSIWGYHHGQDHNFLRITVALPTLVRYICYIYIYIYIYILALLMTRYTHIYYHYHSFYCV